MEEKKVNDGDSKRLIRHHWSDRAFHWVMAIAVLTLLITSFLPILGLKFSWVTIHWIAGLVLTVVVLFHTIRALFWQGIRSMYVEIRDLKDSWDDTRQTLLFKKFEPAKPGKYPVMNKMFHHSVAVVILATIVTGLPMMLKIDTPFWKRNPYWLTDDMWGVIYVLHGLGALILVTFIMMHIYFAVRPENLWLTRSMILGWITVKEYFSNFDSKRWQVNYDTEQKRTGQTD